MNNLSLIQKIDEAKKFINCEFLESLSGFRPIPIPAGEQNQRFIRIYHILKIVHEKKEDTRAKLASIFNAVMPFCNTLALLIKGQSDHTDIYIGVRSRRDINISADILHDSMSAHFPGSLLEQVSESTINSIFNFPEINIGCLNILPSIPQRAEGKPVFGLERFIDMMHGKNYLCEILASPCSNTEIDNRINGFEELYTSLSPFVKQTLSSGRHSGKAISDGFSKSISLSLSQGLSKATGNSQSHSQGVLSGFNFGMNMLLGIGVSNNISSTETNGTSSSKIHSSSTTDMSSLTEHTSTSKTMGTTDNVTVEWQSKSIENLLKTIDTQISRLQEGKSFGMWKAAVYFFAPRRQDIAMAANTFRSLVTGTLSRTETNYFNMLDKEWSEQQVILKSLKSLEHPVFEVPSETGLKTFSPVNLINGVELPLLLSVPEKSVVGLAVANFAEFGRNVPILSRGESIEIGHIYHMGQPEPTAICMDLKDMASHCFVTGSTGSGKSNAVYHLLEGLSAPEKAIPFLVIEPAKGEYRDQFRNLEGISLFSTNPHLDEFLKLNPFSFSREIHVLEHLDRLIEIFNTCWEMYAAMPAILKEAFEVAYISKGWDLVNSVYMLDNKPEFPTFIDVLKALPEIINQSQYSSDTKGDYIGSLVTRVNSLTNGLYGQIFCDEYEIDNRTLFDHPAIIDLSRVGSSETTSLIMGILLLKLNEYRISKNVSKNAPLCHITVLEEAHKILKSTQNQSSVAGGTLISKSVEMIVNSIAEMRTYGEGFIIVDQSPTSVDIAAIKNTNTKIIMRLPEREDGKIAGHSIALNQEQEDELPHLETGQAVVMKGNWEQPILAIIGEATGKYAGHTSKTTHVQIKALRSTVISDLIDQYIFSNQRNSNIIRSHIASHDIADSKKKEMIRLVNLFESHIESRQRFDSIKFGHMMIKMTGCNDTLRHCEALLRTDENGVLLSESVTNWLVKIHIILENYVMLDERHKEAFLQYILYAKKHDSDSNKSNYAQLYHILYDIK